MSVAERSDEGFALIAVLCWTILLSVISGVVLLISRSEATDARTGAELAKLTAAADAGINMSLMKLLSSGESNQPPLIGTSFLTRFESFSIRISIEDESGKLDINTTPAAGLAGLLRTCGWATGQAATEAGRVVDWREAGAIKQLSGAKADDYANAKYTYAPREAPFQSTGELQLVMGFEQACFNTIESAITVVSNSAGIDVRVATVSTLKILEQSGGIPPLTSGQRRSYQPDAAPAQVIGHAFTIRAQAEQNGFMAMRTAVLRFSGNFASPIWVYSWQ